MDKNKLNGLPVFEITFDEEMFESGINMIALTEEPAIEVMSMRFNKDKTLMQFNKDKQLVIGPAIIPDKPIYRRDGDFEFYVVFTKDVIEKMVEKFNSEQREIKFNLEHDSNKEVRGFIKESWIVEDKKFDKSNVYGFDVPVGTWMISAKVTDKSIWNDIVKNMDSVGFSIEGLMGTESETFNKIKSKNKMSKVKKNKYFSNSIKTKRKFNKSHRKFEEEVVVSDEMDILIAEDLEEGTEVETITDEGVLAPAEDGSYLIPDEGVEIEITDGVITEVEEVESVEDDTEEEFEDETPEAEVTEEEVEEIAEEVVEEANEEVIEKIADLESKIEEIEGELKKAEDEDEEQEFKKASAVDSLLAFNKIKKK